MFSWIDFEVFKGFGYNSIYKFYEVIDILVNFF